MVETSLIPGGCKTGMKREDWESLWLRVYGWKPPGCQRHISYLWSLGFAACQVTGSSGVDLQITSWPWVMRVKARVRSWGCFKQHEESKLHGWGAWSLLLWVCLSSS